MKYHSESQYHNNSDCPVHPKLSDEYTRKHRHDRKNQSIDHTNLTVCFVAIFLGYEYRHQSRERYHAYIAHKNSKHRYQDKYPEPRTPHICPCWFGKSEEHGKRYRVQSKWNDWWCEHDRLFSIVVDEWTEPNTTKKIQHEIYSSEHPCDKDTFCFKVCPKSDSKPKKHVGKPCYGWVCEDVGEEVVIFHEVIVLVFVIARHEAI